jgi:hypothetical protein
MKGNPMPQKSTTVQEERPKSPGRVAAGKALAERRAAQRLAAMEAGTLGGAAGSTPAAPPPTTPKTTAKPGTTSASGKKGGATGTSAGTTGTTMEKAPMGIVETNFDGNWSQNMLLTSGYLDQAARLFQQAVVQASEGHLTLAEQYRLSGINFVGQASHRLHGSR